MGAAAVIEMARIGEAEEASMKIIPFGAIEVTKTTGVSEEPTTVSPFETEDPVKIGEAVEVMTTIAPFDAVELKSTREGIGQPTLVSSVTLADTGSDVGANEVSTITLPFEAVELMSTSGVLDPVGRVEANEDSTTISPPVAVVLMRTGEGVEVSTTTSPLVTGLPGRKDAAIDVPSGVVSRDPRVVKTALLIGNCAPRLDVLNRILPADTDDWVGLPFSEDIKALGGKVWTTKVPFCRKLETKDGEATELETNAVPEENCPFENEGVGP